ncbi:MAG TPA: hypothetical protein VF772_04540 [Terriglobales bacterium]
MIWVIESEVWNWDPWPAAVGSGFDFAEILKEGIEAGIEEIEYVIKEGEICEACGTWAICYDTIGTSVTPTDRGDLIEEQHEQWCMECRRRYFLNR